MIIGSETILYVTLFLAVLLLVEGMHMLVRDLRGPGRESINRRLRMVAGRGDSREVLATLRRERQDPLSASIAQLVPSLERLTAEAGLLLPLVRIVLAMAAIGLLVFAVGRIFFVMPILVILPLATAIGMLLPLLMLMRLRARRLKAFGRQLPDAIDLIVRSVRAGHPVGAAMELVSREMQDPIGSEFGTLIDEMTYGLSLSEALESMARRVPHMDLRYLVVTVQIQHQAGGNLAEVLANLSRVIRDRFAMHAKIRAVSAEGRAGGLLVSLLPFFVPAILQLLNPTFFGDVMTDPLFWPLIGIAAVLLLLGQFTIWRLVRIKV